MLKAALALLVSTFIAWFVATLLGLGTSSVTLTVVLRTLLVGLVLALIAARLRRRSGAGRTPWALPAGGLIAYLLNPGALSGRALAGQLVADPGVGTWAIDLVLWIAILGVTLARVKAAPADVRRPYQSV